MVLEVIERPSDCFARNADMLTYFAVCKCALDADTTLRLLTR
jgi:hypothetical protein